MGGGGGVSFVGGNVPKDKNPFCLSDLISPLEILFVT